VFKKNLKLSLEVRLKKINLELSSYMPSRHRGEVEVYLYTCSTTVLEEGGWVGGGNCHALAALPPEKTPYPFYRRLAGPRGWSGWMWETSPPECWSLFTKLHYVLSQYYNKESNCTF
jgi:hypothetical protein